jgi:hypothetical protein
MSNKKEIRHLVEFSSGLYCFSLLMLLLIIFIVSSLITMNMVFYHVNFKILYLVSFFQFIMATGILRLKVDFRGYN